MIETLGWHKDQWLDIDKIFIAEKIMTLIISLIG